MADNWCGCVVAAGQCVLGDEKGKKEVRNVFAAGFVLTVEVEENFIATVRRPSFRATASSR